MGFVRILTRLLKDPELGKRVIPIVPDESRTFGMEGLFRQIGIHSYLGQLYTPQDAGQLSYYKEAKDGQILQEGINESGAICSWIAAGTAYSNHGRPRSRSTSSIRCSACSASVTWPGPPPMRAPVDSCWVPPPAAPH